MQLNDITIAMRKSDGYVNATQLCQAGGKKFGDWFRLEMTKTYINAYISLEGIPSNEMHTRISELIKHEKGSIHKRATWVHQDLAINIAQWISPLFNIKVSRWIRELLIAGKVELGKEKTSEELDQLSKELESLKVEHETLKIDHQTLEEDHKKIKNRYIINLRKRMHYKMKTGPCIYLWHDGTNIAPNYKFGFTENINDRLQSERTTVPCLQLDYVVYCSNPKAVEALLKERYSKQLLLGNHEILSGITVPMFKKDVTNLLKLTRMEYTEADDIDEYNKDNQTPDDVPEDQHTVVTYTTGITVEEPSLKEDQDLSSLNHAPRTTSVNQYALDGTFVKTWESIKDVCEEFSCTSLSIIASCKRRQQKSHGFQWRYTSECEKCEEVYPDIEPVTVSTPITRKVNQFTSDGTLVNTFDSVKEAAIVAGYVKPSSLSKILKIEGTKNGFIWKYADPDSFKEETSIINKIPRSDAALVNQFTIGGVLVNTFDSVKQAATEAGYTHISGMYKCLAGKEPRNGFIWKYDSSGRLHPNAIGIIRVDSDNNETFFNSAKEAALASKIQPTQVIGCCKGKRKTAGGYKFKYHN
jgi:hypothetical protein